MFDLSSFYLSKDFCLLVYRDSWICPYSYDAGNLIGKSCHMHSEEENKPPLTNKRYENGFFLWEQN